MTMYLNQKIETMPRRELDRLQSKLFRKTCLAAWKGPFYRSLWQSAGLSSPPNGLEDLHKLPFTEKQHLVDRFPYGLCMVPRSRLARMYMTSGSTGRPVALPLSRRDVERSAELGARSLMARGIRPGDVIQVTLAFGLWAAGFATMASAERLGCMVIPSGPGNTRRQLWLMKNMGTTILSAVPSYHLRIAEVGRRMGMDFSSLPLRMAVCAAGPLTENLRREIEDKLGVVVRNAYGTTELGGVAGECVAQNGLHIWHDAFVAEVVDPENGEPVEPGEYGELVVTTLAREAIPLIRYRTGDRVRILSEDVCDCGRTHLRISGDISRLDDSIKIRGVLVRPRAIERYIGSYPELSGEFLIRVQRNRRPTIFCELRRSVDTTYLEELSSEISKGLKERIGLTFNVEIVPPGGIPAERPGKRVQILA